MFEVGKKYKYIGGDTLGLVIEVLHTTNNNAMIRIINHNIVDSIGHEHIYSQNVFSWWKEHKEPRTITRWVNVFDIDGELSIGPTWSSKEKAMNGSCDIAGYKDTIPITYTEPS